MLVEGELKLILWGVSGGGVGLLVFQFVFHVFNPLLFFCVFFGFSLLPLLPSYLLPMSPPVFYFLPFSKSSFITVSSTRSSLSLSLALSP